MDQELLERDAELAELRTLVAEAVDGRGGVAHVVAPAGMGKTRLVEAAQAEARRAGARLLVARGRELERGFPFGVVLQLLEPVVRGPRAERLLAGPAALATDLLRGNLLAPASLESDAVHPVLHGLHWLVLNLAEERPVALVLDDAHWADALSLRTLAYLGARLSDAPVALVVAARPAEAGAPAELPALAALPGVRALAPAALGPAATATVLERRLGTVHAEVSAAAHDATGGNPLLLSELAAALAAEGVGVDGAAAAARVREIGPAPVGRAVQLALAPLPPTATALARAVAVLGDGAHPVAASALAGLPAPADAVREAAALARAGVFAPDGSLAFTHPILRAALHQELAGGERALAHARAAELLRDLGAGDAVVAAHLQVATPTGAGWAVEVLRRAASAAVDLGAPEQAAVLLARALQEPPAPAERADVLLALGEAEAAAGLPGADARLQEALALVEDPRRRAATQLGLGRVRYQRGEQRAAAAAFRAGLDALGDPDDPLVQELAAGYLTAASVEGTEREAALERVSGLLADRPADTPAARALLAQRTIEQALHRAPRQEVRDLADRAWDGGRLLAEQTSEGAAPYHVTGGLFWVDELERQRGMLDAALADAQARGSVHGFATASYCCCWPNLLRGAVAAAAADAEQALAAAEAGWALFAPAARAGLAIARLERDEPEAAWAALDEEASLEASGSGALAPLVLEAGGRLREGAGDLRGALERYERAVAVMDGLGWDTPAYGPFRALAAEVLVRLGDRERAQELAREELGLAEPTRVPRTIGVAQRALALAQADVEARLAGLAASVATLEGSPSTLELVRSELALGAALRRAGRPTQAREPLRAALDQAVGLGLVRLARLAREELKAAGGRPRRERMGGPEALTPAERRVCELVAAGRTNRETAQALFVTPKAVEYHLRNAYGKLGITGRAELAAALTLGSAP